MEICFIFLLGEKMTEARQKGVRKVNENKSTRNKWGPQRVHRMNWKVRFQELTGWRSKNDEEWKTNDEERLKIFAKSPTETLRKRLGLDFLHGNNFPQQFQVNTKCQEGWTLSFFTPPPIYSKIGEELATQLAQASQVASSRSNCLLEEESGRPKWAWLLFAPFFLLNTPPFAFFGDSFSITLRNKHKTNTNKKNTNSIIYIYTHVWRRNRSGK